MFEPSDNIPQDWPARGKRNGLREMLSMAQWRRRMVDFAKFVMVQAIQADNTLDADDLLDAWLDLTFDKPKAAQIESATKSGYKEHPTSTSTEMAEPNQEPQYFPDF